MNSADTEQLSIVFYLLTVGIFSSLFNFYCYRSNISEEKQILNGPQMNYGEIWCEDITIQIHKSHVKVENASFKVLVNLWCWNIIISKTSFQDFKNNWLNCRDSVSILAPGAVAQNLDREYFLFGWHRVQKLCQKTYVGCEIFSMHWQIHLIWRWEIDFQIKHLSKLFSRFTARHFLVCLLHICGRREGGIKMKYEAMQWIKV